MIVSRSSLPALLAPKLITLPQDQQGKGDGILPGGRGRSTIFIDTSTIFPATAGKIERLASSKPHRVFLSCPVFGIPRAAESADLILAISGDYFAKKHAAHALVPAIGKKVMDLGSNVERATAFKWVWFMCALRAPE
jgi:3-hydroxyisobutyrate dehydrogenase-like beta-hydroxyacid dehydrogenase